MPVYYSYSNLFDCEKIDTKLFSYNITGSVRTCSGDVVGRCAYMMISGQRCMVTTRAIYDICLEKYIKYKDENEEDVEVFAVTYDCMQQLYSIDKQTDSEPVSILDTDAEKYLIPCDMDENTIYIHNTINIIMNDQICIINIGKTHSTRMIFEHTDDGVLVFEIPFAQEKHYCLMDTSIENCDHDIYMNENYIDTDSFPNGQYVNYMFDGSPVTYTLSMSAKYHETCSCDFFENTNFDLENTYCECFCDVPKLFVCGVYIGYDNSMVIANIFDILKVFHTTKSVTTYDHIVNIS